MFFFKKTNKLLTGWFLILTTLWYFTFGLLPFGIKDPTVQEAHAANITWVGGVSGLWETTTNWSGGAVPTVNDDVTISSSTNDIIVTLSSGQTANFNSLTIGGDSVKYVTTTFIGNIGTAVSTTIASHGSFNQANTSVQTLSGRLTISNGGQLTHVLNSSSVTSSINFSVANLNLASGSKITANGNGYNGGASNSNGSGPGPGLNANSVGSGGGYGGYGTKSNLSSTAGGAANGATTTPELDAGSGGGGSAYSSGGFGGGIVKLIVSGTTDISGTVSANGNDGAATCGTTPTAPSGAGAGGGVRIQTQILSGAGSITALGGVGGNSGNCTGGNGGGGRILISVDSNTFTGTTSVAGGSNSADGQVTGGTGSIEITPNAPAQHFSNATNAQSGSVNPTLLTTTTPFFSAIFNDPDAGDTTVLAQIQISTSSDFSWISHWDSGSSGTTITSCSIGNRCQDIKYNNFGTSPSTTLALGDDTNENSQTTYYWRLRYFDAVGAAGPFSTTTNTFTLLDKPNAPSGISSASVTASAATLNWSDNSSIDTAYLLDVSEDGGTSYVNATTTAASAITITTSTLSANTRYIYRVAARNSVGDSSYSTSSAFYTLANSAGTPTASAASVSSIAITINVNSNPTSTTYALFNTTTASYLAADGSSTASPVYQTTSTWGSSFAATGLSPNVAYQFVAVSRNGDSTSSATSSASTAVYTLANIPNSLSATASGSKTQIAVTWGVNSNPNTTLYYAIDENNSGRNSGWIGDTTYTFTGLTAGTTYTFKVKARNSDAVETSYSSTVSAATASDSGGSAAPAAPAPPPPPPPPAPASSPVSAEEQKEFTPTGLIKFVAADQSDIDLMQAAEIQSPYKVDSYGKVSGFYGDEGVLDLQFPFTLDFSLSLDMHPLDAKAPAKRNLFSKYDVYGLGFNGSNAQVVNKGLCFWVGTNSQVCDKKPIKIKTNYNYQVAWSGATLDLIDGKEKLDSIPLPFIPKSEYPLAIGGSMTPYKKDKFTVSFYPFTLSSLKLKKNPGMLLYTNKPEVKLQIDSTYAQELALKESHGNPKADFSSVSFDPVASEVAWKLTGEDGKKCVNARFKGTGKKQYTFDTYTCAILDRVPPPANFSIGENKLSTGQFAPKLYGTTEPNAKVIIYREQKTAGVGVAMFVPRSPLESKIYLAGATTTYYTTADEKGDWAYTIPFVVDVAQNIFTVKTVDLAGNISKSVTQDGAHPTPPGSPGSSPASGSDSDQETPPVDGEQEPAQSPEEETPATEEENPPVNEEPTATPEEEPAQSPEEETPATEEETPPANEEPAATTGWGSSQSKEETPAPKEETLLEEVVAPVIELVEQIQEQISDAFQAVKEIVISAARAVRAFADNPKVEKANEVVAAPILVGVGFVNLATGVHLPRFLVFLQYIFGQPFMLLRRRKQKAWGVVYNSLSKLPVDLATLRLIDDETKKVVRSQVTDLFGRYFLSAGDGRYKLEVIKPGFTCISNYLKDVHEDSRYINLYHGESFSSARHDQAITFNIPLDPEGTFRSAAQIVREHTRQVVGHAFSIVGFGASVVSFGISPKLWVGALMVFHIFVYAAFRKMAHRKKPSSWGIVRSKKDQKPISGVVVRVFDAEYNKLVNTAVTDRRGRYAVLVGPSRYFVTFEKAGFNKEQSPILDYSENETGRVGSLIARSALLSPTNPDNSSGAAGTATASKDDNFDKLPVSEISHASDIITEIPTKAAVSAPARVSVPLPATPVPVPVFIPMSLPAEHGNRIYKQRKKLAKQPKKSFEKKISFAQINEGQGLQKNQQKQNIN